MPNAIDIGNAGKALLASTSKMIVMVSPDKTAIVHDTVVIQLYNAKINFYRVPDLPTRTL